LSKLILKEILKKVAKENIQLNKRPMGHIAHLSNTGSYENIF
jgi:hypothetical protein